MDRSRPRTSRPRERPEPLFEKPLPPHLESATEKNAPKLVRPKTACLQPIPTSSKNSSGVRRNEKYFSARDSTDSDTIIAVSPNQSDNECAPAGDSSGVRSMQGDEKYFSAFESTDAKMEVSLAPKQKTSHHPSRSSGEQSEICLRNEVSKVSILNLDDAETVVSIAPKQKRSHHQSRSSGGRSEICLRDEAPKISILNLDDAKTVVSIAPKQKRSHHHSRSSGGRSKICLRDEAPKISILNLDDAKTVVSIAPKQKRSHHQSRSSGGRSKICLRDEAPKISILNLDDAKTVVSIAPKQKRSHHQSRSSGGRSEICSRDEEPRISILNLDNLQTDTERSSVLKSAESFTDLKLEDSKRRDSSGSRNGEQLKEINFKNMLFFRLKNLASPNIENNYESVEKKSSFLLQTSETTSNDKTKEHKDPSEKDFSGPVVAKEAVELPVPATKKTVAEISASQGVGGKSDKKIERNRSNVPEKPKFFMASGCGKGIPSLESLPKPKIGRLPLFISKNKKDKENKSLKSRNLNDLENKEIKPASSRTTQKSSRTDNSLMRSRIPLRKRGSQSTTNLIPTKESMDALNVEKSVVGVLKRRKSVTFTLPEPENSPRTDEPQKTPNTTYLDPFKQEHKKLYEKLPAFGDGPLPTTEPSKLYKTIKNVGWNYSRFSQKQPKYPAPTIPYDFLDKHLEEYSNVLERAAVHTKYWPEHCSCDQKGDPAKFCEKHIDATKLQNYEEVAEVMVHILSSRYEVPEYEEAEKLLKKKYPSIYLAWVFKIPTSLTLDYRVREAKCKAELVGHCKRVLQEEDYLAEFTQSEEIIGSKRDISISGRMEDVEEDFELSYTFLFKEYPHLFIQLVEKIEFMPLAIERGMVASHRQEVVKKAKLPDKELQALEKVYRAQLQKQY